MTARMDRLVFTLGDVVNARGEYVDDWRWSYVSGHNGNVLAVSSEGYRKRIDAVKAAARATGHGIDYLRPAVKEAAETGLMVETVSVWVVVR